MGLLDAWRDTRQNIINNRPSYTPMYPAQDYSGSAYSPSNVEPVETNEATLDPRNPYLPRKLRPESWSMSDLENNDEPQDPINFGEAEGHAKWADGKNARGLISFLAPFPVGAALGLANTAANIHATSKAQDVFGSYLDPDIIDHLGGLSPEDVGDMIGSEWGGRGGQVFDPTTGGWNFANLVEANMADPGKTLPALNRMSLLGNNFNPFGSVPGSAPLAPEEYIDPDDTYYDNIRDNEGNFTLADSVRLGLENKGDNWWDYAKGGRFYFGDYGRGWNDDGSSKTDGQADGTSRAQGAPTPTISGRDMYGTSRGLLDQYFIDDVERGNTYSDIALGRNIYTGENMDANTSEGEVDSDNWNWDF